LTAAASLAGAPAKPVAAAAASLAASAASPLTSASSPKPSPEGWSAVPRISSQLRREGRGTAARQVGRGRGRRGSASRRAPRRALGGPERAALVVEADPRALVAEAEATPAEQRLEVGPPRLRLRRRPEPARLGLANRIGGRRAAAVSVDGDDDSVGGDEPAAVHARLCDAALDLVARPKEDDDAPLVAQLGETAAAHAAVGGAQVAHCILVVNLGHAGGAGGAVADKEGARDGRARDGRHVDRGRVGALKERRHAEAEEDAEEAERDAERLTLVGGIVLEDRVSAEAAEREHVELRRRDIVLPALPRRGAVVVLH